MTPERIRNEDTRPPLPEYCPEHEGESLRLCRACIADVKCGDRYLKYVGRIQPRCARNDCSNAVDGDGGQIYCWDCSGGRRHLYAVPNAADPDRAETRNESLSERTAT